MSLGLNLFVFKYGPEPDLITSFQSDSAGNFTIGFPGREADFSLIDPERGLYRETIKGKFRSYMIPASNVRKFDIIRYADTPIRTEA